MFRKLKEYQTAFQQGQLDSLADNAYLNIVVLISLFFNLEKIMLIEKEKLFQDIIKILNNYNADFKKLKLSIFDIENIYKTFSNQILEDALKSYKDVYTEGGDAYSVLKNEYKLSDQEILKIKSFYRDQVTFTLENLYALNNNLIPKKHLDEHLNEIYAKLSF